MAPVSIRRRAGERAPVGLFRPYERTVATDEEATTPSRRSLVPKSDAKQATGSTAVAAPSTPTTSAERTVVHRTGHEKKSTPTRTRAEAEAARMAALHPTLDPKAQKAADREAKAKRREASYDRMENTPEKVLLRDYLDARWTITEFLLPVMVLGLAFMLASTYVGPTVSSYVAIVMWTFMFMALINVAIVWFGFRRVLDERLPGTRRTGLLAYLMNRAMMVRRWRTPSPRIPRGGQW